MFKLSLCLFAALLVCAQADNINKDAAILSERNDPADAEGHFAYAYDTSNGISAQESGNPNGVNGQYSYISPEGESISLTYTADENGFQPTGAHLPVAPEVPPQILRALEYIAAHPPQN